MEASVRRGEVTRSDLSVSTSRASAFGDPYSTEHGDLSRGRPRSTALTTVQFRVDRRIAGILSSNVAERNRYTAVGLVGDDKWVVESVIPVGARSLLIVRSSRNLTRIRVCNAGIES